MKPEEISALDKIVDLIEDFTQKNIIPRKKINISRIRKKVKIIKNTLDEEKQLKQYKSILDKLTKILSHEITLKHYFIIGGHGGIIINDIGFCEFDSPNHAMDALIKKMELAIETDMPYNLEIAISCLEWLNKNATDKFLNFLHLFKQGKFEIINPSYSQPYNLIIGAESNIKQFEYGLNELKKLGLDCNIYYCSESSLHPQIPQILKEFNIKYGSLRTRLLGVNPTSISSHIKWIGLDNSSIETIIDQSGVFNGEYWHGTFFKEIPNLLFQSVSRPFMNHIIYSNLEDFRNPQPLQEEIWRVSKHLEIFGKFLQCADFFDTIEKNGEFKYKRDEFFLGEYIFTPSELFLQNKNSEILLITAEIINCMLGIFDFASNDTLFDDLWKKLLLAQAHDCYAVPFIRSGDYTETQLGKEELEKIEINFPNITISKLSLQIHEELQERCQNFINESLSYLVKALSQGKNNSNQNLKRNLVVNPTPYTRRDVISINSDKNSVIEIVEEIPQFGYKIISYSEDNNSEIHNKPEFFYNVEILNDLKTIQVDFEKCKQFKLTFSFTLDYKLILEEKIQNAVSERSIILGKMEKFSFRIEIIQYRDVNRLEFIIDSHSLHEIILKPLIEIKKSVINYPFGIEETRRSKIQTLDFMWLKGSKHGIIYIQKNSQKFKINRENFEIQNLLTTKGKYEFAISITDEDNSVSPLFYVNSYLFRFLTISIDDNLGFKKNYESFLSINPIISMINLWRRENGIYLRLFNPGNTERTIKLSGKLVKDRIKELDFNYNEKSLIESKNINLGPWKIMTLKF